VRGGFGRGRGPVVCHNCQQPGHYAREFPLPPATFMYFHASDHDTEECSTLLVKIQEKRNQNNQNVQWISSEVRDEGQNINIVTRGGDKIGNDVVRKRASTTPVGEEERRTKEAVQCTE
jgi:predicted Zn-dependent protease